MIQVGDKVVCIEEPTITDKYTPLVKKGTHYIVNSIFECPCGEIGLDIGYSYVGLKPNIICKCKCGKLRAPTVPLYGINLFRKVEPAYKVVEVHSEILEQAKELLTPETIAR